MQKGRFYVIGHRGACSYMPENTYPSFDKTIELGSNGIETDVKVTRDGVLVLFHDNTMTRFHLPGEISDHTYAELMDMDFGGWFSPKFKGEHIVRFRDFLARYGGRVHLSIEIKGRGFEDRLMAEVEESGIATSDYMITSFYLDSLQKVKARNREVLIGILLDECSENNIQLCLDNGFECICPFAEVIDKAGVESAHAKGLFVRAWGVGNTDLMKVAYDTGADGMTVNFPDKLIEYMNSKNKVKRDL